MPRGAATATAPVVDGLGSDPAQAGLSPFSGGLHGGGPSATALLTAVRQRQVQLSARDGRYRRERMSE